MTTTLPSQVIPAPDADGWSQSRGECPRVGQRVSWPIDADGRRESRTIDRIGAHWSHQPSGAAGWWVHFTA